MEMTTTTSMTKRKTRLIVKKRDEYVALAVEDIAFIYRNDLLIVVVDKEQTKYLSDKTLSQLESELDALMFFRANRQYIVNINFIKGYKSFEKVKLALLLKIPHTDHQVIISQKTAPLFRKWLSAE
jgi:DNA-binding LytR/AlgR family response regulator